MSSIIEDVAIVGAGLAGTALAIALQQRSIPCRLYEAREEEAPPAITSGVVLFVNGCKTLDDLGVLARIREKSYKSDSLSIVDENDNTVNVIHLGNRDVYGYAGHRLYRSTLLNEMRAILRERGVPIFYGSRFKGVVDDGRGENNKTSDDRVVFSINGRQERASLLVGADGIHSTVRKHLTPLASEYTGKVAIAGHIATESVAWPRADFPHAASVQGQPGSLVMIPEVADGSEMIVGYQVAHEDEGGRAGWDALNADPGRIERLLRRDYERWHPTARAIIDAVCARPDTLSVWPFRQMPPLDSWASPSGRVVLVGDAAHAIPPSSGQGVGQALEDVHSLAILLAGAPPSVDLARLLEFWKRWRQARLDDVLRNMAVTDVMRLPKDARDTLERDGKLKHLPMSPEALQELIRRIYTPNTEAEMNAWLKEQS